jgi:hypothetical protein
VIRNFDIRNLVPAPEKTCVYNVVVLFSCIMKSLLAHIHIFISGSVEDPRHFGTDPDSDPDP